MEKTSRTSTMGEINYQKDYLDFELHQLLHREVSALEDHVSENQTPTGPPSFFCLLSIELRLTGNKGLFNILSFSEIQVLAWQCTVLVKLCSSMNSMCQDCFEAHLLR